MRLYTQDGYGYIFDVDQSGDFPDCLSINIISPEGDKEEKETPVANVIIDMKDVDRLVALLRAGKMYVEATED